MPVSIYNTHRQDKYLIMRIVAFLPLSYSRYIANPAPTQAQPFGDETGKPIIKIEKYSRLYNEAKNIKS